MINSQKKNVKHTNVWKRNKQTKHIRVYNFSWDYYTNEIIIIDEYTEYMNNYLDKNYIIYVQLVLFMLNNTCIFVARNNATSLASKQPQINENSKLM